MGIHKQEAAKRNALAGITTPDEAVQQPITQLMNMAHALTQARAPQPEPSLQEPSVPHLPNHKVAATAQQR